METIFKYYRKRIESDRNTYMRYLKSEIDWEERLIVIVGARGAW